MTMQEHEEEVRFQIGGAMLAGTLAMPERALGIVLFAHQGFYADGMVEHDGHVGQLLKKLDDLGIADNTIVIYSTDNGPHYNAWLDAAVTPFRGEKNTNWEGGYSVPCFIRWTGKIPAGETFNGIVSAEDWLPHSCSDEKLASDIFDLKETKRLTAQVNRTIESAFCPPDAKKLVSTMQDWAKHADGKQVWDALWALLSECERDRYAGHLRKVLSDFFLALPDPWQTEAASVLAAQSTKVIQSAAENRATA